MRVVNTVFLFQETIVKNEGARMRDVDNWSAFEMHGWFDACMCGLIHA
jgi:hypothetical protein